MDPLLGGGKGLLIVPHWQLLWPHRLGNQRLRPLECLARTTNGYRKSPLQSSRGHPGLSGDGQDPALALLLCAPNMQGSAKNFPSRAKGHSVPTNPAPSTQSWLLKILPPNPRPSALQVTCTDPITCHCHSRHIRTYRRYSRSRTGSRACSEGNHGPGEDPA